MMQHKKYILLAAFILLFIIGIVYITALNKEGEADYKTPSPKEVVELYFSSWNNKDYPNMYSTISDGFKKIDPTAKSLQDFREYVGSQNIESVEIMNIKELNNNRQTASVDYNVVFIMTNGQKLPYEGTFTLKYREGDVIQGWKLIHPYGEDIDNS